MEHISRLLAEGGSVAVPGIGVFVSAPVSADYSEGSGVVTAPHSRIVFERSDSSDAGRLRQSIMRRKGGDADAAARLIEADVAAMLEEASCSGEVSLGGAGTLVVGRDGTLSFVQSAGFVDFSGGAWLEPLKLSALVDDGEAEEPDVRPAAPSVSRTWLRWTRTTAAAMIVFAVVTLVTVFANRFLDRSDSGAPVVAGMVASPATSAAVGLVGNAPAGNPGSLVLILNTPSDGASPVERRPAVGATLVPDAYCLIVASLATEAEAMDFCRVHSTKAIPLGVLRVDGRYRIYAASAPTMPEVLAISAERGIGEVYASSWVCRN